MDNKLCKILDILCIIGWSLIAIIGTIQLFHGEKISPWLMIISCYALIIMNIKDYYMHKGGDK